MEGLRAVFLALPLLLTVAQQCRLSNVHGDTMVLQRAPQSTTLFGFAAPGTVVTTAFRGANFTSTATASGEWRQPLPATPASAPSAGGETISFSCSTGEAFALRDVLFGDVVLCGGQSNMQFTVHSIGDAPGWNATAEIAAANGYPAIRTMTVGQVFTSSATHTTLVYCIRRHNRLRRLELHVRRLLVLWNAAV